MAQILDDNTVVPSWLSLRMRGDTDDMGDLTNNALRVGEVKEIIYPSDPLNINKRFIEYTVEVQHRDGYGPGTSVMYRGCTVMNLFGGKADVFRYTLRKDEDGKASEDGIGVGSKVLLLCPNGTTSRAIIIGGVRDTKTDETTVESKDDGHNLYFEFNGVAVAIDKDGQLKIEMKGPTKVDGTLDTTRGSSEADVPTTIEITKKGNFKLSTKDNNQYLFIDHENKQAEFHFDKDWKVTTNGTVTEKFGSDWTCTAGASISIDAQNDISFNASAGAWNMGAAGNVRIRSAGVLIGNATDAMLKGTTFRIAHMNMHTQMQAALTQMVSALSTANASFNAGLQAMKVPIVGPIVASGIMQPIGIALGQMTAAVGQMIAALIGFEAQSATYLSPFNKSD
jgi:hypothetical protein